MGQWDESEPGVVVLPSGRAVRGRGLRRSPPSASAPDFGLYLTGRRSPATPWPQRWVRWPDFWLPSNPADARAALAWVRRAYHPQAVETPWQRRFVVRSAAAR